MSTRFCPNCGAEYLADIALCADCQVPLADQKPAAPGAPGALAGEQVIWDLGDWSVGLRIRLDEALMAQGVPHVWEGEADLVVPSAYEEMVDELLDRLEHPDQLAPEDASPDDERAAELLSELFLRADRLAGNPDHHVPVGEFVEVADQLRTCPAPFGVPPVVWEEAQALAAVLRADLLAKADRDLVAKGARRTRDLLRPYV